MISIQIDIFFTLILILWVYFTFLSYLYKNPFFNPRWIPRIIAMASVEDAAQAGTAQGKSWTASSRNAATNLGRIEFLPFLQI